MADIDYELLGEAHIQEDTRMVPVPQPAINMELVKLSGEVFWGHSEETGYVAASELYDPFEAGEGGFEFVTSSKIDDERMLQIPDAVMDLWADVTVGDHLNFVTADQFQERSQFLVLTDEQADELLGEE